MPVHNTDIAHVFNQVADLLEIRGENQFRIRAYRDAARTIGGLSQRVEDMIKSGEELSTLSGIGKDLAGKIEKIVKTGRLPLLEEIKRTTPAELSELMKIPGLGAKMIETIYRKLNVISLEDLKKAAENKEIRELPGFGKKTEQGIIEEIEKMAGGEKKRFKISTADEIAETLLHYLKQTKGVKHIEMAGSYRRRRETVGDLDILVSHKKGSKIMDRFSNYDEVEKILSKGRTRSSMILRSGLQVDLRAVPAVSYGAALQYFTGSKSHGIAVRKIARKKKLKINEYGVFKGNKRVAGKTEREVYKQVGLPYIEPELRENRGEIEAAQKKNLPQLVTLRDIRGDLHAHTKLTDGHYSLQEMAEAAKKHGYEYLAITEHSQRIKMAHGLDEKGLARQIKEIDRLNGKLKGITVLKGIELDILDDGSLDLADDILKELDVVVCSVHYKFNLSRKKQTDRIVRAMDNPYFHILAHPSGRLINERHPYDIDIEHVLRGAKERGCFLELNAYPDRLDLTDVHCKMAKDMGVKVAISTDAHSITDLDYMKFGIGQARRGWLEPGDILNTRSWKELKQLLRRT